MDLTVSFRGVKVRPKSGLKHWHEVLEEWCVVHERYCRMVPQDAIFWHSERTNAGALAAAVWRAGAVALEEYPLSKTYQRETYNGRSDLWLGSTDSSDYIEAKFRWLRAPGTDGSFADVAIALDLACEEALPDQIDAPCAGRVGLVFCAVTVRQRDRSDLDGHVRGCVDAIAAIPHGAIAWCFPTPARALTWVEEEPELHPGIILLARSAPRRVA